MKNEKIFKNKVVDIEDPSVPGYVTIGVRGLMGYLGASTELTVYRAIERGELPPGYLPGQWTVAQIREWKILMSRVANAKALQNRLKGSNLSYEGLSEFYAALAATA